MITKAFVLTSLLKLMTRVSKQNQEKISSIINEYNDNIKLELQQRAVEYMNVMKQTQENTRSEILKPMPVPDIAKLIPKDEMGQINGNYRDELNELKDDDSNVESDDNDNNDNNEINIGNNNSNNNDIVYPFTPTSQTKQTKQKENNNKEEKSEDENDNDDENEDES